MACLRDPAGRTASTGSNRSSAASVCLRSESIRWEHGCGRGEPTCHRTLFGRALPQRCPGAGRHGPDSWFCLSSVDTSETSWFQGSAGWSPLTIVRKKLAPGTTSAWCFLVYHVDRDARMAQTSILEGVSPGLTTAE